MCNSKQIVYLSTGSNLGNRALNLQRIAELIDQNAGKVLQCSPVYMSEPWGFSHPRYFLNQIIKVETMHDPDTFHKSLQIIEISLGRTQKNSSNYEGRTADIDILTFGSFCINTKALTIPHPRIHQRLFVLLPLNDIAPDWQHPSTKESIQELLLTCSDCTKTRRLKL